MTSMWLQVRPVHLFFGGEEFVVKVNPAMPMVAGVHSYFETRFAVIAQ